MLEFYEFNTLNIIVVLVSTFIIYYIMSNYLTSKDKKSKETQFSLEYLIISVIISVCISLIVAYAMSSGDESVLTDNFWDPIKEQSPIET